MLSAQMQCMDVMIEMLRCGGNLRAIDNEGYTPMAYANSLPCPSLIEQNVVSFIMEGDTHGTAKFNTTEILKIAVKWGVGDLKDELEMNREAADDENIENHIRFLRLMEKNGLTRMETLSELNSQARGTLWRIQELEEKERINEEHSETSSELRDREARERFLALKQAEEDAKTQESNNSLKCPLCTLALPCAHFFRFLCISSTYYGLP